MTLSLEMRLERLEKEARFDTWLWFERFLESLTEQQLEDLATHWRWPEPMPPPLPIGASKLDSLDRKTLRKSSKVGVPFVKFQFNCPTDSSSCQQVGKS